MAWVTPRTWVTGEVVTSSIMNTHVRDNFLAANPEPATALPASPQDGDVAILVDSVTAPTWAWRLRYDTAIADAYKWLFVGGSPMSSLDTTGGILGASTATDYLGLAVPVGGIYRQSMHIAHNVNSGVTVELLAKGNTTTERVGVAQGANTGEMFTQAASFTHAAIAASQSIYVRVNNAGAGSIGLFELGNAILPVRVG